MEVFKLTGDVSFEFIQLVLLYLDTIVTALDARVHGEPEVGKLVIKPFGLLVELVRDAGGDCFTGGGGRVGDGLQDPGVAHVVIASSARSSHVLVFVYAEGLVGIFVFFGFGDLGGWRFAWFVAITWGHGNWSGWTRENAMAVLRLTKFDERA